MKRNKIGITITVFFLFIILHAFSASSPLYIESRLYYYPKSVADNKSQAIDLSSDIKYLTTSSYNNDGVTLVSSPNNLAVFRISENLMPHKDVYTKIKTAVTTGVNLYVKSLSNWEFVKEDNPTQRIGFSLDAFCTQYFWNKNQNKYVANPGSAVAIPYTFNNGYNEDEYGTYNTSLTIESTISTVGDTCTIFMPYTPVSAVVTTQGGASVSARIPTYKRDFDICIHINGDTAGLAQGYYYTTLEYSVSGYYESPAVVNQWQGTVSLPGNDYASSSTGTITVWAYVGDVLNGINEYFFSVSPAADTYSMVLGKTDAHPTAPVYDIATLRFYHLDQIYSTPNQDVRAQRFKIYISPTSNYEAAGEYCFIKMNTEGQARNDKNTIYYDLGLNTSAGFKYFDNLNGATLVGDIGSASVYANNTYVIKPKYTNTQTSASSTYTYWQNGRTITATIGEDCFTEYWKLEQDIYLRVTDASYNENHLSGMYHSWIYLTLVAN